MAADRIETVARHGLVLDVHDTGPVDGPVAVLLHGWPADASCWSAVAPRLVEGGLRVVALDQRTVAPGARPRGRRAYRMPELVADVRALLARLGDRAVHLVGHDWGGAVAWSVAAGPDADRLASLTVLSTPHPRAMAASLVRSPQLLRSAYIGLFQVPVVPELLLGAGGGRGLEAVLRRSGLGPEHAARYVDRMQDPDARSASLGWYRALPLAGGDVAGPVAVPTTYAWSTGDTALDRTAAERTADHVTGPYRFVVVDDAPHWLPEERPALVADLVLAQLDRT